MSKRVLITGANGFIGRYAARRFKEAGYHVVGIGHGAMSHDDAARWGLDECVESDVTLDALTECACGCGIIVHCAGGASVGSSLAEPMRDFERTVWTTHYVLEHIRINAPSARLIYPSSAAVYGVCPSLPITEGSPLAPISPYGTHKRIVEDLCRMYAEHYEINVSVLRVFSVYGEGLRKQLLWDACEKIRAGRSDFWGTGGETRDWIHAEDAARAILTVSEMPQRGCSVINVGSGVGVRICDILKMIFKLYGAPGVPVFNGRENAGNPVHFEADVSILKKLGWQQKVALADGVRRYVEWYKKETGAL